MCNELYRINYYMKEKFKKYRIVILGIVLGTIGGYLYYYFIGCSSGTCPLTSNPYRMMIYGAIIGFLVADIFKKKDVEKDKTEIEE